MANLSPATFYSFLFPSPRVRIFVFTPDVLTCRLSSLEADMYSSPVPSQPINLLTFLLGLPSPTSSHFPVPTIYIGFQPQFPASFPPFHSKSTFTPTLTSSALVKAFAYGLRPFGIYLRDRVLVDSPQHVRAPIIWLGTIAAGRYSLEEHRTSQPSKKLCWFMKASERLGFRRRRCLEWRRRKSTTSVKI